MAIFIGNLQSFHFLLLIVFALFAVFQTQDQSGFISIDCGNTANNYTDAKTTLLYLSDPGFVDSGISRSISTEYSTKTYKIDQPLLNLRSFPENDRNCYEIGLKTGRKYLIRAVFLYGNYDAQNDAPTFDIHIGSKKWDTIDTINSSMIITREVIHLTTAKYIEVCLVNTGSGTPFISTLELRPLKNNTYSTDFGSLKLFARLDVGSSSNQKVRYVDDVYDRIWEPYHYLKWSDVNSTEPVGFQYRDSYQPPAVALRTAGTAANPDEPMTLIIDMENFSTDILVYMYFAEIVKLKANQSRIFNISLNGKPGYGPVRLDYLYATTVYTPLMLTGGRQEFSLFKVQNSTLPPLMNAFEVFTVVDLSQTLSNQEDVDAIKNIKKSFGIKRNWQGDPCVPQEFQWDGLNCSYIVNDVPRIISLNLSSAGLTGEIPSSISSLTSLQYLDLSNNSLEGSFPDNLAQLPLKVLNLASNKLSGSVPASLIEKSDHKLIELSVGGNPELCASKSCEGKKSLAAPIVASIAGVIILVAVLAAFFYMHKRKTKQGLASNQGTDDKGKDRSEYGELEPKGRRFTYSEVVSITSNFKRVLGKGGFGTVYHGYSDDTQVAVKMLSPSSAQGYKQFQAEVRLLLRVHHKNLTSLVGFCDEGANMGLVYEYMSNGDIEHLLSGSKRNAFTLESRLQIVVEAAQGLEYLHNGCKPPIVHRDVKPSNILLNEKFQAKLSDFGLSRSYPVEGGTHISTVVAGTPGYLDPEYYVTNWLTEKSDVFSFGVVLLKIITGRPVIATEYGRNTHICQWVESLLDIGDIKRVVDPRLGGDFDMNSAWKAVEIAMACTSSTSDGRPTMHQVVTDLNQCLEEESERKNKAKSTGTTRSSLMTHTIPLAR